MATQGRSITDVFQDIVGNVQEIVRSEVRLAKSELRDEMAKIKASAPSLVVGAVAGLLATFFLAWAAFYALSIAIPMWAAALVVAGLLAIIAGAAGSAGIKILRRVRPPVQTIASVKENVQWAKQQVK